MIIERIDVKSFGQIRDTSMEFSATVNVIEGENEAGKSTIAAFIRYMLFGFGTPSQEGGIDERRQRVNWENGIAQGSMTVRVKGKKYLVSRSTVMVEEPGQRVTYKEDSSIIDLETGATAFGKVPAGEVFFGVSRELFENTAFIGQIGDSSINEGSVCESIENILFSGSERMNNQRAASKINEKMEGLVHRGGGGGVIIDLTRKRDELGAALERAREETAIILDRERELHGLRTERAESEEKLNGLYDLDSCYKNVMLIQTFDKLHELEEESIARAEAYTAFVAENTREGFVPDESYLASLIAARRAVNDTYHALNEAEEAYAREKGAIGITREIEGAIELADELGGEDKILAESRSLRGGLIKSIGFGIFSLLLVIAAAVYQIAATGVLGEALPRIAVGTVGACALVFAVILTVFSVRYSKRQGALAGRFGMKGYSDLAGKIAVITSARIKRDGMIRSTECARLAEERARIDYENARTELTRLIIRWGEEPPTTGLNDFLDNLENRVSVFLEKKRMLLEDKNSMELTVRELRRTLSDKNEIDIRAMVPPFKRKSLATVKHDEIINGIAMHRARIAELDREAAAVEGELIGLKTRVQDPGEIYARICELDSRIAELAAKHKAYFVAHKSIESASDNLRAGISPRLGKFATDLMGIMTDRRYTGFSIDEGLRVSYTEADGTVRSVDFLSGGTRDLAYVAVRMALIDMLYTEAPPVVLDESFAHQDNVRARSMMRSLAYLAGEGYQSFVFTCRGREGALAEELAPRAEVFKLTSVE